MGKLYKKYLFKLIANPFAYLACFIFSVLAMLQFLVMQHFFSDAGSTDLHRFFTGIPYISILIIPALGSMLAFSDDELSLPFSAFSVSFAKILSLLSVLAASLALTFLLPVTVSSFGDVDIPPLICSYFSMLLFLAASSALTVFLYTCIENPGAAFVLTSLVLAATNSIHLLGSYIPLSSALASLCKWLSFAWHFDAAGKGILDTRDLIFYISSAVVLGLAAAWMIEKKRGYGSSFGKKISALVFCAFILLSLDSSRIYGRLDLSSGKKFTVSPFSRQLLSEVEDSMTITYYRSAELKNFYPQVRDVSEYLQDYASYSKNVSFKVVDPAKENAEKRLENFGISSQAIRSTGKNTEAYTKVYSAVVVNYHGKNEIIPFILSVNTLEYDLAGRIQSLVRGKERIVQVVVGNGLKLDEDYAYVKPWLEAHGFTVVQTNLPSEIAEGKNNVFTLYPSLPLVVFGTALFTQEDAQALLTYIQGGGKVFLAMAPYNIDVKKTWSVIDVVDYVRYEIQSLGLYFRESITADENCFRMSLYSEQNGAGGAKSEFVDYSLWPELPEQKNAPDGMVIHWPCAIDIETEFSENPDFIPEQHLVTSKKAWQYKKTDGKYETNPFATPLKAEDGDESGQFCVSALLRKKGDENPSAIVFGDQYAFASGMIGYSSSQSSVDTRSLEFLSDSMLSLNGEQKVLDLKNGRLRNSGLYKKSLDEIYSSRHGVFSLLVIVPALILFSIAMIVHLRRRKFNQSGRK